MDDKYNQTMSWLLGTEPEPGQEGGLGFLERTYPEIYADEPVEPVEPQTVSEAASQPEGEEVPFWERQLGRVREAGEFGLGWLEPFGLFQDPLFALAAGLRDPERNAGDYMREIDWRAYAPGGDRPNRPLTGKELLQIYGVTNEGTQQVGGFVLDVVGSADMVFPLMWGAGGSLRTAGKAVRASGLRGAGDALIDSADAIIDVARKGDDYMGLIPTTRDGVTRSLDRLIIPESVRDNMVAASERVFNQLFQVDNLPQLLRSTEGGQRVTNVLANFLPGSIASRLKFGDEAGTLIFQAGTRSQQTAESVRGYVLGQLSEMNRILGDEAPTVWNGLARAIGLRRDMVNATNRLSTGTRDSVVSAVSRIGDEHGAAVIGLGSEVTERPVFLGDFIETVQEIGEAVPESRVLSAGEAVDSEVARIRDIAIRNGDNADYAEYAFRESLRISTESDALIGYHLSMYEPVKNHFFKAVTRTAVDLPSLPSVTRESERVLLREVGMLPQLALWRHVMRVGMEGGDVNSITRFPLLAENGKTIVDNVPVEEVFGTKTVGGLLEQNRFFQQTELDIGTFLNSVQNGHLRRVYAAFQDDRTFNRYLDSLKNGRIFASNIIDEENVATSLARGGFDREGSLIQQYITDVGRPIVNQGDLLNHLIDQGVSPERARSAVANMLGAASSTSGEYIRKVEDALQQYRRVGDSVSADFGIQSPFARERAALTDETLQLLGELANPILSLEETSRFARSVLPRSDFLRRFYEIAEEYNLVSKSTQAIPGFTRVATSPTAGPFSGMQIHPFANKLLDYSLKRPEARTIPFLSNAMNQVRGGLLTGGNVLAVNVLGGISSTMSVGLNPVTYIGEMMGATRDFIRLSRGDISEIEDLEELRQVISLNVSRLGDVAAAERGVETMRQAAAGLETQGLRPFVNAVGDVWRTAVDNPAQLVTGSRPASRVGRATEQAGALLGLQGFSGSETMMKLAAYRTALKSGFNKTEAAELARINVFDYSEIPDVLRLGRDFGILPFPGFPYFIAARNAAGLLRRPAATAAVSRIPDAIYDAQMDEDEKAATIAALPEWLRKGMGISVRTRTDAAGNSIRSVIPFGDMLPNLAWTRPGADLGGMISSLGLLSPLFDGFSAYQTGTGEAPIAGAYGTSVFTPDATAIERVGQTAGFIFNSFAPTGLKNIASYTPGRGTTGIIPSLMDSAVELPAPFDEYAYSDDEILNRRIERDFVDNLIGSVLRKPTPIVIGSEFSSLQRALNTATYNFNQEDQALQERYQRAMLNGDQEEMKRVMTRMRDLRAKFYATWAPTMERVQRYLESQGNNRVPTP